MVNAELKVVATVAAIGHVGPAPRPADKSDQPLLPLEAAQDAAALEAVPQPEPPANASPAGGKKRVARKGKSG